MPLVKIARRTQCSKSLEDSRASFYQAYDQLTIKKMKKIRLFLAVLVAAFCSGVQAQVTIGSTSDPHPGAVLDLQSTKGFKLPVVDIHDANTFQLSGDGSSAIQARQLIPIQAQATVVIIIYGLMHPVLVRQATACLLPPNGMPSNRI